LILINNLDKKGNLQMNILYIGLAVLAGVILIGIIIYNGLVKTRIRVDEAWSDISVQLKRRYDLVPNLINTVKGYAAHEKAIMDNVSNARNAAISAGSQGVGAAAKAEAGFAGALKSLFAVAEAYPDLKANENFRDLQAQLVDTEDKIQASRRFYNGAVRDYNTKRSVFPSSIFAGIFGFGPKEFFEVDASEAASVAKPVEVKF
jgi:LemA protein